MKKLPSYLVLLLAVTSACNNQPKQNSQRKDTTTTAPVPGANVKVSAQGNPIDYSAAKVLDTVFVMPRQGAALKEAPDAAAPAFKQLSYAEMLHTIERQGDWFGVMYYVNRKYTEAGKQISASRWEKLYVAAKDVVRANRLTLTPADLDIVSYALHNGKPGQLKAPAPLNAVIKLELVDERTYRAKQAQAVNFFNADTNTIRKVNGVLNLPLKNGIKKFVDKPDAEEQREVYEYQGQIEALNAYLLTGNYYESGDYKLVSSINGKLDAELSGFPYLAGSKAHVLSVSGSEYDGQNTTVELLQVTPNGLKKILEANFVNWFPVPVKLTDAFWSSDNCFYVPVLRTEVVTSGAEWQKLKPQYLKISLR